MCVYVCTYMYTHVCKYVYEYILLVLFSDKTLNGIDFGTDFTIYWNVPLKVELRTPPPKIQTWFFKDNDSETWLPISHLCKLCVNKLRF